MSDIRFCRYVGGNNTIKQILYAAGQMPIAIIDGNRSFLVMGDADIPVLRQDIELMPSRKAVHPLTLACGAGTIKTTVLPKPFPDFALAQWADGKSRKEILKEYKKAGWTKKQALSAFYWHEEMDRIGEPHWTSDAISECWEIAKKRSCNGQARRR